MSARNNHIDEFIEYYCRLSVAPEYALLIKGAWGSGKSHIVKETMTRLEASNNPIKFLYLSLYGMSSLDDIETKFFQLLNPVLSSKGAVLAGKIAKGLLKGALKIDLNDDGKADGSISIGTPEIDLQKYLIDTSNLVLIFDDLERSSMHLKELLGYINYFVEKEGYKVILIGDEDKIYRESNDDASNFDLVKEKLIGKTLKVEPDIEFVFDIFKEKLIDNKELIETLDKNKEAIVNQFDRSKFNNLRSLRKFFIDFERFYSKLDGEVKAKDELISHLIILHLILSLEVHGGSIQPIEIPNLIGASTISRRMPLNKGKEEKTKFDVIEDKYAVNFYETLLNIGCWIDLFDKSYINKEEINRQLKLSSYFLEENTAEWVKLWNIYDIDEDDFIKSLSEVEKKIAEEQYLELGVIKHLMGIFLKLSDEGLCNGLTRNDVMQKFKNYIDNVFKKGLVDINEYSYTSITGSFGFANLAFHSESETEFREFSNYLNQKTLDAQKQLLASKNDEITEAMRQDPLSLYFLICHSNDSRSKYHSKPIMQYIDLDEFIKEFMNITNKGKRTVINALYNRYKDEFFAAKLTEDFKWLLGFQEKLKEQFENKKGTITSVLLRQSIERIGESLQSLKNVMSDQEEKEVLDEAEDLNNQIKKDLIVEDTEIDEDK